MKPEQFRQLTSLRQMELLFEQGQELMCRIYVYYNIKLYALSNFFVEVWYRQAGNKIDRIVVLEIDDVIDLYEGQIDLKDLY